MTKFTAAIASAENQPQATFRALEQLVHKTIGVKLFTITERHAERGVAWRSYSNMPEAYPVTGEKPLHNDRWSAQVVGRGEAFVANSVEEFADVFADHEHIAALGCESCLNLPIIINGEMKGTLNCLHEAGHFTPERVAAAEALKLPGAVAFLMAAEIRAKEENRPDRA